MSRSISRPLQLLTVARYELLKYLRGKRMLAATIFSIAIPLLILALPLVVGLEYPNEVSDFSLQFVGFLDILIIIGATFFGSDALVSEFQQKTGYALFPNPITRTCILFGKYLASSIATLTIIGIFYTIVGIASYAIYGVIPVELLYSLSFATLYTLTILALAFFISSILKGTTGTSILTFLLFFLIFPIIDLVLTLAEVKPWFSPTFATGIMSSILISPYPSDVIIDIPAFFVGGGENISIANYIPEVNLSIGILLLYMMFGLLFSLVLFMRREMT